MSHVVAVNDQCHSFFTRDVVLTKEVWERTQKLAIFKQLQTQFTAKHEKRVGAAFPRVPAPLHPFFTQSVNKRKFPWQILNNDVLSHSQSFFTRPRCIHTPSVLLTFKDSYLLFNISTAKNKTRCTRPLVVYRNSDCVGNRHNIRLSRRSVQVATYPETWRIRPTCV